MAAAYIRLRPLSRLAGVIVAAVLMVMAGIGVARAGHDTDASWVLEGTGHPQKTNVVNDDTNGGLPASFEYNVPDNKNFRSAPINGACGVIDLDGDGASDQNWTGSWQFATTANGDGGWRHLDWRWEGSHAFTNVFLETYIFVNGSTVQLLNVDNTNLPSGAFDFSGSTTVRVDSGDAYGFILCMSNGDTGAVLEGSLTVESLPTFDASLSASPELIAPGDSTTVTLTLDPDGHDHTLDQITLEVPAGASYDPGSATIGEPDSSTATIGPDEALGTADDGTLLTWNGSFPLTDPTEFIVDFGVTTDATFSADNATLEATATRSYTSTAIPAGPFTAVATFDLGVEPSGTTQLFRAVPLAATGDPSNYPPRLAILGFVESDPDASGTFTLYHSDTCSDGQLGTLTAEFPIPFGDSLITTDANGNSFFGLTIPTTVTTGYVTGSFGIGDQSTSCTLVGPDNDSWTRALRIPLSGGDPAVGSSDGVIDSFGTSRWYKFAVQPGATATVTLRSLPDDYDLAVFTDIAQAYTELTDPTLEDLNKLGAEFAPSIYSPSIYSPSIYSPSIYSGGDYAPSIYSPSIYSPSIYSPSIYSPSIYSPSIYSPSIYSPSIYSPSIYSPSIYSPSIYSPSIYSDDEFSPSIYSPDAFANAQIRSIIGVSTSFGTTDEVVVANTWDNTGDFYIRVTGKNGVYDAENAFDIDVELTGLTCPDIASLQHPEDRDPAAGAGTYETVILWDSGRIISSDAAEVTALSNRLDDLAAATNGVVVDLAADAEVQALQNQARTNFNCIYATNLAADSIKNIIDSYRTDGGALRYAALVGGDESIPFYRYPDQATLGPEKFYQPPVADSTISQASLRLNHILGQDEYGSQISVFLDGTSMPIPDLGVGRVVETAGDAIVMIDAYLGTSTNYAGGVLTPTSSLTTAYDFLTDTGLAVTSNLEAGMGANLTQSDQLIDYSDPSPGPGSWTADDLRTSLLDSGRHDLVFLAGHFSANSALAADYATSMITTELAASSVDLVNSIVIGAGCHVSYNIVDGEIVLNVTLPLDWGQAFAQKGATLIGGTGYQYGETDFIEYSERLYVGLSAQLSAGTGPVSVGEALVRAKQDYMATTPDLRGLHRKSLVISSIFGLPMISVDMPGDPVTGLTIADAGVTPIDIPADPSRPGTQGLSYADLSLASSGTPDIPYTLTQAPLVELESVEGGTVFATYLEGSGGIVTHPGEPVIPLVSADVGLADRVMRGIVFLGGSYADTALAPNVPLTGAPTTELSSVHPAFVSPNFFPLRIATANYFGELTGDNRTILNVTPTQHQAFDEGSAVRRVFDGVDLRLYYSSNTDPVEFENPDGTTTTVYPALSAPPNITNVVAYQDGLDTVFEANVTGDPEAGIQQVWITYDDTTAGAWVSIPLTQDTDDSTLWTGAQTGIGDPDDLDFMVQAVNGVGLVAVDDNFGNTFSPAPLAPPEPSQTAILSVTGPGTFGSDLTVETKLTEDDGTTPIAGQTIVVSVGNNVRFGTTDGTGVATLVLPLDSTPGEYQITATFFGGGGFDPAATSQPFTITKAQPTVAVAVDGETATLDQQGDAIQERTVYFHVVGFSTDVTVPVITDFEGVARLPDLGLPGGTYKVWAYFLGNVPNIPNPIGDTDYLPDSDGPQSMVVPTELGDIVVTPDLSPAIGESVDVTATFGPAIAGSHTATIAWGDGTTTDATITESEGVWSLSGSHTYGDAAFGPQTIVVTLYDTIPVVAATASVDIDVVDETPPTFDSTPADITEEATSADGATAIWTDPTATDNVDTSVDVACSPTSGSLFPLGATSVTCTATDDSGNEAQTTFTVTVVDTTAPTFDAGTIPVDQTVEAADANGATATWTDPTATDAVDAGVDVACNPASGSLFPLGATLVTCTATDDFANATQASFTVTVVDTTAPVLTVPADLTVTATSLAGVEVTFEATATDTVDPSVDVVCVPASGDVFPIGVTTVTCTATDDSANSTVDTFDVTVEPSSFTQIEQLILELQGISDDPAYDRTVTRDVDAAIRQLEKAMGSPYWDPTFTSLDPVDGDRVFDRLADAVSELKKIDPATLTEGDDADLIFGADGIIQIMTEIAEGLATETVLEFDPGYNTDTHQLSCDVAAGPPCSSIQQDLDKAYLDWDAGVEENAIRDFRNAWRTATDALAVL